MLEFGLGPQAGAYLQHVAAAFGEAVPVSPPQHCAAAQLLSEVAISLVRNPEDSLLNSDCTEPEAVSFAIK